MGGQLAATAAELQHTVQQAVKEAERQLKRQHEEAAAAIVTQAHQLEGVWRSQVEDAKRQAQVMLCVRRLNKTGRNGVAVWIQCYLWLGGGRACHYTFAGLSLPA